ncbi:hypothetical protein ABQX22_18305 [Xanthomonas sp. WHRI 1810A]|uniref:hypothetical protein n=1 Tax=Xanthomonas sp. WHRI 1810A TaxID=3161565 RepID=UPI0032E8EDCB
MNFPDIGLDPQSSPFAKDLDRINYCFFMSHQLAEEVRAEFGQPLPLDDPNRSLTQRRADAKFAEACARLELLKLKGYRSALS